ncbi:MAG TPA: hypothetical protein VKT70_15985 [Stellaceae bacterium]|nr:hypothetical protein [Stellaceae bacterium]
MMLARRTDPGEPRLAPWRMSVQAGQTQGSSPAEGGQRARAAEPLSDIRPDDAHEAKLNEFHDSAGEDEDIGVTAFRLVARFGEQATSHALLQALKARERGEVARMEDWRWIADATREILRTIPETVGPELVGE